MQLSYLRQSKANKVKNYLAAKSSMKVAAKPLNTSMFLSQMTIQLNYSF